MLRLRVHIIALLLFTGIALNIERLDYGSVQDAINLASFVYLLAGAAVISTVLIPYRWRLRTSFILMFWTAVYLAVKVMQIHNRPIIGGQYTYLSIAELSILLVLIAITRKVMENLHDLEETVANITLADVSGRVKDLEDAAPDINLEFNRSRRHKRPLGLIVVRLEPENVQTHIAHLSKDILRMMTSRYSMSKLIMAIDRDMRRTDLILKQHKENRIILVLPEADPAATQIVYNNIQRIAAAELGSLIDIGCATFPEDAITFEALVTSAEEKSKSIEPIGLEGHDVPSVTPNPGNE